MISGVSASEVSSLLLRERHDAARHVGRAHALHRVLADIHHVLVLQQSHRRLCKRHRREVKAHRARALQVHDGALVVRHETAGRTAQSGTSVRRRAGRPSVLRPRRRWCVSISRIGRVARKAREGIGCRACRLHRPGACLWPGPPPSAAHIPSCRRRRPPPDSRLRRSCRTPCRSGTTPK